MCLDVKQQKAKKDWLFLRINFSKKCTRNFFTDWNESSKVHPNYLEILSTEKAMVNVSGAYTTSRKLRNTTLRVADY